jgi:NADP-dependent 3-hydroxy acid dehydrogenase YdfG
MGKIALITGATSGFGKACAEKFGSSGYDLIITGRREDRLEKLQEELQQHYNVAVYPLVFDVQNKEAVFGAIEKLDKDWCCIEVLINNAGLALGRDYFDEASIEDWEIMINTNLKGLLYVTKAVLPFMIKQKKGHIINIGSTAGKEVYEKGNVYCASKHAVAAVSESMRIDLLRYGIRVTAIHPGAAETEFSLVRFKGDTELAASVYSGIKPLTGADIAEVAFFCATLPDHVCVNELVMTCTAQANSFYIHRQQ